MCVGNYTRSVLVTQSLHKSGKEIRTHLISLLNEGGRNGSCWVGLGQGLESVREGGGGRRRGRGVKGRVRGLPS